MRPLSLNIVQFWESVAPKFRTNAACEACFDGHKLVFALHHASRSQNHVISRFVTSAGPCVYTAMPSFLFSVFPYCNPLLFPLPNSLPHKLTPRIRLSAHAQGLKGQMKIWLPSKPINSCDLVDESHRNQRWQPQQNARPKLRLNGKRQVRPYNSLMKLR